MAQAPTVWFGGRLRFNDEAFGQYVDMLPPTKTYRFMNSGIVTQDGTIAQYFNSQVGSYSQRIPIYGSAEADEVNYDGETPMGEPGYITADSVILPLSPSAIFFNFTTFLSLSVVPAIAFPFFILILPSVIQ